MTTSSQSYPMSGGDDQHSYIHNSSYQKAIIDGVEAKSRQYILGKLDLNSDLSTFTIADFGCSIGPNTFHAVQNIIDVVKLKESQENSILPLEFQVYFNDLPNNDFNTLFRTQPPSFGQECFSVGVPGSFYGRVLPKSSLHIGHTSYTTHWLSKVPEHVCDKNKYYIQCNGLIEEVIEAYKAQFTEDMRVFLKARAEELVSRGLMIISGSCLPDGVSYYETWGSILIDSIGDCLLDMATSGVTTKEKVELFNIPMYFPQYSELKREIEKNPNFTIELMETSSEQLEAMELTNDFAVSMFPAIFSTIIETHFGDGVVHEVFNQLAKKLTKHPIDFENDKKLMGYCIVLKRK